MGGVMTSYDRTHWMPDDAVDACMLCESEFSFWKRRHHCRACGGLFCASCSSSRLVLPSLRYEGALRVCDACFEALSPARGSRATADEAGRPSLSSNQRSAPAGGSGGRGGGSSGAAGGSGGMPFAQPTAEAPAEETLSGESTAVFVVPMTEELLDMLVETQAFVPNLAAAVEAPAPPETESDDERRARQLRERRALEAEEEERRIKPLVCLAPQDPDKATEKFYLDVQRGAVLIHGERFVKRKREKTREQALASGSLAARFGAQRAPEPTEELDEAAEMRRDVKAFVRASFERAGVGWAGAQLVCRNYKQTMLYAVRYIVDHYARRTSDLPVIRTAPGDFFLDLVQDEFGIHATLEMRNVEIADADSESSTIIPGFVRMHFILNTTYRPRTEHTYGVFGAWEVCRDLSVSADAWSVLHLLSS